MRHKPQALALLNFFMYFMPSYQTAMNHISMITSVCKPSFLRRLRIPPKRLKHVVQEQNQLLKDFFEWVC